MTVTLANKALADSMSLPGGLLIELVTPLSPTGALDVTGLGRLVQWVAPWAAGVVAGSPGVGEALALPPAQRRELYVALLELLPPDLPLVFGITGATLAETLNLAQELEQTTSRCPTARPIFWLDLPLWWHSNRGLPQAYEQLNRVLQYPVVLVNHPHLIRGKPNPLKHVNIRTAVLKKLSRLPMIAGLIYQGELRRFLHYYAAAAARPEFKFFEADERRFLTRPGAGGLVSAGAQLFPETWREVVLACLHPDQSSISAHLREQSQLLFSVAELYQLQPAPLLKQGLYEANILSHATVWPTTPAAPAHVGEKFQVILEQFRRRWA